MLFQIVHVPIDPTLLRRQLENEEAGACATFEGWVRRHNEGQSVDALEYETYEELANKEGLKIIEEACSKFGIFNVVAVHRVGLLKIGELAVWVAVTSAHRDQAFTACRYVIDEVKARVPIWKKEHYQSGSSGWIGSGTGGNALERGPSQDAAGEVGS